MAGTAAPNLEELESLRHARPAANVRNTMMTSLTLGTALVTAALITVGAAAWTTPFPPEPCSKRAGLGSIQLPHAVLANGKPLTPGTYQVSLTSEQPTPPVGQSPGGACWVEFLREGTAVGREVATLIPSGEIDQVAKGPKPKPNDSRVDVLKGGDYIRAWIQRGNVHYIINMPRAR
jgi:hypothetical protein